MVFCTNPYMFRFSRAIRALLDLKQNLMCRDVTRLCQTIKCQPEEIETRISLYLSESVITQEFI